MMIIWFLGEFLGFFVSNWLHCYMRVKCFELMILPVFDLHVEVLLIKKYKRILIVKLTYMISYTKMLLYCITAS